MDDLTEQEQAALAAMKYYRDWDSGYSKQQSTRPQTLGYGLVDSPAGQCAWIVEKFWAWTDCDGDPENVLSRDELLDNVMLYWLPGHRRVVGPALLGELRQAADSAPVEVPVGLLDLPEGDLPAVPALGRAALHRPALLERAGQGGHFAAFEQPAAFVDEVRAAFRAFR